MKDVVILSGGFGSTLAICQTIGKKNPIHIYVFYLEGPAYAAIKSSKYVTGCYDVTSYDDVNFYSYFRDWYQEKRFSEKPVLFCTSDRACLLVGHHNDWFQTAFMLTTPSAAIIGTYNSKLKTSEAITKIGVKAPRSVVVYKGSNIKEISSNWDFPVIIKPVSADQISDVGFKVKIVYDRAELEKLYADLLYQYTVVVQEYIAGGDDKSWFYISIEKDRKYYQNV